MKSFGCYLLGGVLLPTMVAVSVAQPAPEAELSIEDECELEALGESPDGESAEAAPPQTQEGDAEGPTEQSLTDALDPCAGVLEPPPVGDRELTIPPPAGGETPVIPPRALPDQQL